MSCPRVTAGKGETLPLLLRLTTRNSGKAQMPFCFWIWAYSELFAYRELGSGRFPPSCRNGEHGKDEKGARNLKIRFQFFLRFCEV